MTGAGDGRGEGEGEGDGDRRRRTRGWHNERTERGNATTSSRLVDEFAASISCIIWTNLENMANLPEHDKFVTRHL